MKKKKLSVDDIQIDENLKKGLHGSPNNTKIRRFSNVTIQLGNIPVSCPGCAGKGHAIGWDSQKREFEITCGDCDGTGVTLIKSPPESDEKKPSPYKRVGDKLWVQKISEEKNSCTCGAEKCNISVHSDWCDWKGIT